MAAVRRRHPPLHRRGARSGRDGRGHPGRPIQCRAEAGPLEAGARCHAGGHTDSETRHPGGRPGPGLAPLARGHGLLLAPGRPAASHELTVTPATTPADGTGREILRGRCRRRTWPSAQVSGLRVRLGSTGSAHLPTATPRVGRPCRRAQTVLGAPTPQEPSEGRKARSRRGAGSRPSLRRVGERPPTRGVPEPAGARSHSRLRFGRVPPERLMSTVGHGVRPADARRGPQPAGAGTWDGEAATPSPPAAPCCGDPHHRRASRPGGCALRTPAT